MNLDVPSMLLFATIKSVVKLFKVPVIEVVAAQFSNESALLGRLDTDP